MAEKTLEFRGIPLRQLIGYLLECGGKQRTDRFPLLFHGDQWQAEILREEDVQITSRFLVNAVFIRFRAHSPEALDRLIAAYRKKSLRVGG
jgi:hypothetical protein